MASMYILTGFAILYATDNIFAIIDRVAPDIVAGRSCMFCFKFVVRFLFFPIHIRQTHEMLNHFHNFALSKTKFLSSPSKQLRCIHGGAKAEGIDLFQRSRLRYLCPTSRP